MDYKFYVNDAFSDNEIFILRDNVTYKLECAIFHFQLLLEYHNRVQYDLEKNFKNDFRGIFNNSIEYLSYERRAILEAYSLFDSMVYHLCSIFDYLFRLINFCHGDTIAKKPLWNLFQKSINKDFKLCSEEMCRIMDIHDKRFIYPLIQHRSHLIHTAMDIGQFKLSINLDKSTFDPKFLSTELFNKNFPEIAIENDNQPMTIKYSALWLIDKAIITATELLFELSEDMKRNKKVLIPNMFRRGPNGEVLPTSAFYWGDRNDT